MVSIDRRTGAAVLCCLGVAIDANMDWRRLVTEEGAPCGTHFHARLPLGPLLREALLPN